MIIKLDHYRKSRTRAIVDGYYSQTASGNTAPEREPAKILYAVTRPAPRPADSHEDIATPARE